MVNINVAEAAGNVEVTIGDTGVGISPEDLPHVFERFHQIDSSTKRSHGGLGLGLAIVRHLVELHGGTVSAESGGTGKGTTFRVSLPVAKDVTIGSGNRPELSDNSGLRGVKILVVDDNADSLEMCCISLEQLGAQTRSATTCSAALEIFAHWRPDVLISDLGMPEQDGFDLIKQVRSLSREQGGDIPAAALTAYARNEDRELALNAGFHAHIPKPVEIRLLADEISRLLNGHK
jgi:CheY-like chemotaxis protein